MGAGTQSAGGGAIAPIRPTFNEAEGFVVTAVKQDDPNPKASDTLGRVYPGTAQRTDFINRVVGNTKAGGFAKISAADLPNSDTTTLNDIVVALTQKASQ
jgi:hypothetical protein